MTLERIWYVRCDQPGCGRTFESKSQRTKCRGERGPALQRRDRLVSHEAFCGLTGANLERRLRLDYRLALMCSGWTYAQADALIEEILTEREQGPMGLDRVAAIRERHMRAAGMEVPER